MITRETIDKVFETARVEEVIGDFVQLKRAGSNYKGLSPFSEERTPSFMVSPVKQIWKDFSTGKGGNAVTFLMEHEHFSYPEAIRFLAKKYNIEIEETQISDEEKIVENEKESLYLVSEFAAQYFHETLLNFEEGKAIGLTYFKERGFTTETIAKFKLGYSPNTWDAFTKEALSKAYKLEFLEKTGLTIVNEEKQFDRFKGRVMFPIQSMSGRILGFGGRILTQDKKAAKYLNSPESDIYHKSKVLYGIFHAKQAIAKQDNCYLVEGYTDVIQLHQSGVENVVASSGTALTPEQIRLINRLTKNITVLFDGDAAGLRASIRGIDLILEAGMNVKVCTFPEGEDPDSFARKKPYTELLDYLQNSAMDFIQFKASILMNEAQNDPIKKADLIRDMVTSISKIPDRIKREIYVQETSRIMDISEEVLFNTLAQIVQKNIQELGKKHKELSGKNLEIVKDNDSIINNKIDTLPLRERSILELLLLYGNKVVEIENIYLKIDENGNEYEESIISKVKVFENIYLNLQEDEIEFADPLFNEIYKTLIFNFNQNPDFDKNQFLNQLDADLSKIVIDIIMNDEKYKLDGWMEKKNVFVKEKSNIDIISRLLEENIIAFRESLIDKIRIELSQEYILKISQNESMKDEYLQELKETLNDYNKLKTKITSKIGRTRTTY